MTDRAVRDVIVVGGGMAGIAAAHALSAFDVQVLERDPRPGGRVKTVAARGGTVDLGACLAFSARLLPEGATPPSVCLRERGPLGIQLGSQSAFAGSAWGAVEGLGLPEPARQALVALRDGASGLANCLSRLPQWRGRSFSRSIRETWAPTRCCARVTPG